MTTKRTNNSGLGTVGVLQIVFIVLKLTGNIDWDWHWVFSPILLPLAIVITAGVMYGIVLITLIGLGVINYDDAIKKIRSDEQE